MTPSFSPVLFMCLLLYLAGMIQVWVWAIGRVIRRTDFALPEFIPQPRNIPWGIGTMILVLITYVGVNLGALEIYLFVSGRERQDASPVRAAKLAVAKETTARKSSEAVKPNLNAENAAAKPQHVAKQSDSARKDGALLSVTEGMFLLTLVNELLIVLLPCLVRMTSGGSLRDLGVTFEKWPAQVKIGAASALLIAPVVYLIQLVATLMWASNEHPVQDMIRSQFSPGVAYLAALSAVITAPIVEEIMFRGLIQNWLFKLAKWQIARNQILQDPVSEEGSALAIEMGPEQENIYPGRAAQQAIVMTSFFFAIVHFQQWPAPIPIFLLSLALGTLYQLTGSLLASISMHATFNSISTLLLLWAMTVDPKDLPLKKPLPPSVNSWSLRGIPDSIFKSVCKN